MEIRDNVSAPGPLAATNSGIAESHSRVDNKIFYQGSNNSDEDFAKVSRTIGEFNNSKMYIDDSSNVTIEHIQREARKIGKNEKVGILIFNISSSITKAQV